MMKQEYVKVEGHESLVRDKESGAILNTDLSALDKYRRSRKSQWELQEKVNEIDDIKQELAEIKSLLHQLVK
jgi:flagellin-specific chaperone FliS